MDFLLNNNNKRKKLWKIRNGPPGRGAVAGRGQGAAGPSQAVGRGPLVRRRPWAAGLLLAKPPKKCCEKL